MGAPNKDEMEGKYNQAKGSIKEGFGRLTGDEVPASDKRVTFLGGLEAYELAGGPVRRDLFADGAVRQVGG